MQGKRQVTKTSGSEAELMKMAAMLVLYIQKWLQLKSVTADFTHVVCQPFGGMLSSSDMFCMLDEVVLH